MRQLHSAAVVEFGHLDAALAQGRYWSTDCRRLVSGEVAGDLEDEFDVVGLAIDCVGHNG